MIAGIPHLRIVDRAGGLRRLALAALLGRGPAPRQQQHRREEDERDHELGHVVSSSLVTRPLPFDLASWSSARASSSTLSDSTSVPSGCTTVSGCGANSGKKSCSYSARSRPSSSTRIGTRRMLSLRRMYAAT